jgi:hypothetical protein
LRARCYPANRLKRPQVINLGLFLTQSRHVLQDLLRRTIVPRISRHLWSSWGATAGQREALVDAIKRVVGHDDRAS